MAIDQGIVQPGVEFRIVIGITHEITAVRYSTHHELIQYLTFLRCVGIELYHALIRIGTAINIAKGPRVTGAYL